MRAFPVVTAVEDFWLDMGRTQDLATALLIALIVFAGFPACAASLTADLQAALARTSPGATLRVVVGFTAPEGGYGLRLEMTDEVARRKAPRSCSPFAAGW